MSDATSINATISQRISAKNAADKSVPIKLVEIPKSLENSPRPQILRGEIIKVSDNGTVIIKTDKGEIKAAIDPSLILELRDKIGNKVDIKIERGNPPQHANIKLAPKILDIKISGQEIPQQQNPIQINQEIKLPPILSAQKLIAQETIKLDLLTPQNAQKLSLPYIDKIDAKPNLTMIFSIPININISDNLPPKTLITQNLNEKTPHSVLEIFSLPKINSDGINIDAAFKMDQPKTNIPLRAVLAQIIIAPVKMPITISSTSMQSPAPPIFKEINISSISPPAPQINHGNSDILPAPRAGEMRAVLVGLTHDKNLPVIKIMPQNNDASHTEYRAQDRTQDHFERHYALQTPIKDIPFGAEIKFNVIRNADAPPALATAPIFKKSINKAEITAKTVTDPAIEPSSLSHIPADNAQANKAQQVNTVMPIVTSAAITTPQIWSVMQEITQVLAQSNPLVAAAFNNIMPNPSSPAQLGGAALFFLAAMRSGDVQSWLGDRAVNILKNAGKSELITRLGAEFSALSRSSSDGSTGEWRATTLPLIWQDEIHKMAINYRKENNENGSDNGKSAGEKTRFVMDLNLSQMGKVQIDGLFIGKANGVGRLDLILRTEQNFSEAMKMEMRQKYKSALNETSFTGELSFQNKPDQWVNVKSKAPPEFFKDA